MTINDIEKRTIVKSPNVQERETPRASPIILSVAAQSQAITPWGVNPRRRDQELRSFWVGESWLASVVYLVTIRNASFAWEIKGSNPTLPAPKNTINKVTQILKNSDRGKGWQSLIIKTCIDLYSQDNGSFWEIIRTKNKPTAPVINIAHLDSAQCVRTGNPEYPVIYTNRLGKEIPLPYWRVVTLEEFPSPYETAFDMQYSAVTRALLAAEIIESISVYKQEKVGGHFTRAIDIVTGVTQNDIDDAVAVLKEQILNRGLYRYSVPLMIPGIDPSNALSHVHIDLASLPDNFDEDTSFKWYVAQLAAAFGVDYQEIAPLMTGNLGSSQQSEIMHLKTRGKGPAVIMALFENIINGGLIPANVEFRFKEQDLRAETEKANARFTRGKDRAFRLKAGEIDTKAARQLAVEDGDLPEYMAKEIDERGVEVPTNNEVTANQVDGGIESQVSKMTLEDVKAIRKKISADPYAFLKSSFGNPSGTVIASVSANEKLLEAQSKMIELYRQSNSRFTPLEQFHITLVYSPLADDMEFRNIKRKVQSRVESMLPIRLQVSELTTFDNENAKALVLLAGSGAEELQRIVYDEFSRAGLPVSEYSLPENWKAHVTLGYVPYPFSETLEPFEVVINSVAFTRSDYREEEVIWSNSDGPSIRG